MFTTSDAADLIGVRYETIRNWLKKGLLEYGSQATDRKWRNYSTSDLCRLQLTKLALNVGIALETIIDAGNDEELIGIFEALSADSSAFGRTSILIWSTLPEAQFMIVAERAVSQELARNRAPVTVIDLVHIHQTITDELASLKRAA